MRYIGEFKGWMGHLFHSSLDRSMRPLIITMAMYSGMNISMAQIFTTLEMIDWLHGPMHHLPRFTQSIRHTKREFRRIQMFLMADEVQGDLIKETESTWGKPALEMHGNFTWGLIAQQEDEQSEEEDERIEREIREKKEEEEKEKEISEAKAKVEKELDDEVKSGKISQEKADEEKKKIKEKEEEEEKQKKEQEKKKEEEKEKLHSIKSKLTLRNINLDVKEGEFVCIIGETGSGKTSLLNAIFGEMAYMSEK